MQLEKDKEQLRNEMDKVQLQLRNEMDKVQELTKRLDKPNSECNELLLVREQVKAYKEDFESERRDRERAQSRLADVEMELEIVKREVCGEACNFLRLMSIITIIK